MSRILKRPMFKRGGQSNDGIMSNVVDREQYSTGTDKIGRFTEDEFRSKLGIIKGIQDRFAPLPRTRLPLGEVGLALASGADPIDALSLGYDRFVKADDARQAAAAKRDQAAVSTVLGQALKEKKKGFKILSGPEVDALIKSGVNLNRDKAYQIDLDKNKISQVGGSGTNVQVSTPPPETQEQKEIGKVRGGEFSDIIKAGNLAIINDQKLEILKAINNVETLKTGAFGELRTGVQKIAEEFGIDPNLQDTTAAEIVTGVSGGLVLDGLQKFSGAISDGERNYTKSITPGLSMTREGNQYLLQIANRQNELAKGYSQFAENWVDQNGGLSKRNADGMSWGEAKAEWHKQNPLIDPDMKETLNALSKKVDTEFKSNIISLDGKQYIYHYGADGKVYYNELK
tara:strand:- start:2576 stop:3775 length:1200 start_codon:yes stop_codon:yes gene_type:complete